MYFINSSNHQRCEELKSKSSKQISIKSIFGIVIFKNNEVMIGLMM